MKKTVNINLSHKVFHIDEDAYERLVEYLDKLRAHFAKEEGCAEILDDIENRIAELFSDKEFSLGDADEDTVEFVL